METSPRDDLPPAAPSQADASHSPVDSEVQQRGTAMRWTLIGLAVLLAIVIALPWLGPRFFAARPPEPLRATEENPPSQVDQFEQVEPPPVVDTAPRTAEDHRQRARQYARQASWSEAAAAWQEAINLDPGDAASHVGLGQACEQLRQPRKAFVQYQRAIELEPDLVEGHRGLAHLLARGKKWKNAAWHFEKVVAAMPNEPRPHFNLGLALAKNDKWQRAIEHFGHAARIQPELTEAKEYLQRGERVLETYDRIRATAKTKGNTRGPVEMLSDDFVGSDACRDCHPRNYDTWRASYHSTMTQVAHANIAMASFNEDDIQYSGTTYRLRQHDGELWIETRPSSDHTGSVDSTHEETPTEWRKVAVTTGSHHMQAYWLASGLGRALELFPLVYLRTEQRWVPFTSIFLVPPSVPGQSQAGQWNYICSRCHNTQARPRKLDDGYPDTHVSEFGISCESCHGPGEKHLAIAESGEDDLAIVNPNDLPPQLSSQVCGQCHSSTGHRNEKARSHWIQHGFSFRPGDNLEEHRLLIRSGEGQFWNDGMIRVSGREYNGLLNTPCYTHADTENQMSCMSCHQLHQSDDDQRPAKEWANDLLKPAMDSNQPGRQNNQACTQCHKEYEDDSVLTNHTHHELSSSGSQCYNCHMPHTTWGVRKAMRSHTVSSPSVQESLEPIGRPNACNLCHMDKTLAWTAGHLEKRYGHSVPDLSPDEKTTSAVVLDALKGDAGQRALAAWTMGWKPAQEISGTNWLPPMLTHLMVDEYDVVRSTAFRSLQTLDDYATARYDYIAPRPRRQKRVAQIFALWKQQQSSTPPEKAASEVLINANGQLQWDKFKRLFDARDKRAMQLLE